MTNYQRRYDIDWLRVIAIGLLLIYHVAISFQPWGVFIGFIQNSESMDWVWIPMSMLNVWRIPILFFISGMGVYLALGRRNIKALLIERSKRILLPYLFGVVAIVPLHVFIWQQYYHQDLVYWPNPGHLWFLGNIFVYVIALVPLFIYTKKHPNGQLQKIVQQVFSHPLGLAVITLPFVLEVWLVVPESFELYAMNWHGFWLGLVTFFIGYMFMYAGEAFWLTAGRHRWYFLSMSALLFTNRLVFFDLQSPQYLMAIESVFWIITIFGFAHRYLNKGSKTLSYLSSAAYPVYILHMLFMYLGSSLVFGMELPPAVKLLIVLLFTIAGCFATYEIIRRVWFLRILFGLRVNKRKAEAQRKVDPSGQLLHEPISPAGQ